MGILMGVGSKGGGLFVWGDRGAGGRKEEMVDGMNWKGFAREGKKGV